LRDDFEVETPLGSLLKISDDFSINTMYLDGEDDIDNEETMKKDDDDKYPISTTIYTIEKKVSATRKNSLAWNHFMRFKFEGGRTVIQCCHCSARYR
jgi:hypothetical protein